jgi:hypothetical protein
MKQQKINPLDFPSDSPFLFNIRLLGMKIAFQEVKYDQRLTSLVYAMGGAPCALSDPEATYIVTDNEHLAQRGSTPIVHSSWIEALTTNPRRQDTPFLVPLARARNRPPNPREQFKPFKLVPDDRSNASQPRFSRKAQTSIYYAFQASPIRGSNQSQQVPDSFANNPDCFEAFDPPSSDIHAVSTSPIRAPEVHGSPRLMELCRDLMRPPKSGKQTPRNSSQWSFEDLTTFSQVAKDEDDGVRFDIEYDAKSQAIEAMESEEKDPLMDLIVCSQNLSQRH